MTVSNPPLNLFGPSDLVMAGPVSDILLRGEIHSRNPAMARLLLENGAKVKDERDKRRLEELLAREREISDGMRIF